MMTVRLAERPDELSSLRPDFARLLGECGAPHPQITYDWLSLWFKHFGAEGELFVLVAEDIKPDGNEVVGIAPLYIQCQRGAKGLLRYRTLLMIGHSFTDRTDFIVAGDREAVVSALVGAIFERRERWDGIVFKQISDASPNLEVMTRALQYDGCHLDKRVTVGCPYIDIHGQFEDFFKSRRKSLRGDVGRNLRRMAEQGFEAEMQVLTRIDAGLLDEFRELDRQRFEATGRESFLLRSDRADFLAELAAAVNQRDGWRIFVFRANGALVAYFVCFLCAGSIHFWSTSFDVRYGNFSPGKVLLKSVLEYCYEQGYRRFDFMAGDEDYKTWWADQVSQNYQITLRQKNLKTMLLSQSLVIAKRLRESMSRVMSILGLGPQRD